jgi:hypothetical protein
MGRFEFRLDLYRFLRANWAKILDEAERIGAAIGIPSELKGTVGVSGASSAVPGTLRKEVVAAIAKGAASVVHLNEVGDEIRRVVKSVYGDDYDAVPISSCEAALGVSYDALVAPPLMGRGEPYRVRCIGLLERHIEHHLSYGRPFPGIHKDLFADRGATSGELGLLGRRQENIDIVMVPLAGARYEVHGIKSYPCPLLMEVDPEGSARLVDHTANLHAANLGGFVSLAYDTAGYGYGAKDADGTPSLQREIGSMARSFGVPYIADNAWGMPFLGTDLRKTGADVMLYSMDKVAGGPTSGLIIGRDAPMVQIRRALGVHSDRSGSISTHGKAAHVAADPGKESMIGILAALRILRDTPERVIKPITGTHAIVLDEFERHRRSLGEGIAITCSTNLGGVEINYQRTWSDGRMGLPIFTHEDRVAHSNLINGCLGRMGVIPNITEDANIVITPGLGTTDETGALIEDRMRVVAKAIFQTLSLLAEWTAKGPTESML